jgi:hypothetical protein
LSCQAISPSHRRWAWLQILGSFLILIKLKWRGGRTVPNHFSLAPRFSHIAARSIGLESRTDRCYLSRRWWLRSVWARLKVGGVIDNLDRQCTAWTMSNLFTISQLFLHPRSIMFNCRTSKNNHVHASEDTCTYDNLSLT